MHLGDVLNDRYAVFRRLATGSQSLVWLARDIKSAPNRRYVAIKVYKSHDNTSQIEPLLPSPRSTHPGLRHLELTLDSFFIKSPHDGQQHFCRVVEPLGRTLGDVMEEAEDKRGDLNMEQDPDMTSFNPMRVLDGDLWTVDFARRACWQVLLGLDALHANGLAHRDLHPNNVCLALTYDLSSLSENEIQKDIWPQVESSSCQESLTGTAEAGEKGEAEEKEKDAFDDAESDSSSDSEDSVTRQARLEREREMQQEKALIEELWHSLTLDPGNHLDKPHSPAWNKANMLKSRAEIILRPTRDDVAPAPRYLVAAMPLSDGFDLQNHNPSSSAAAARLVLTDLGSACAFSQCETHPRPGLGLIDFLPPEWHLGLPTGPKGDIFSLALLFFEMVMIRRLVSTHYEQDDPRPERPYARGRLVRDLVQRLGVPLPSAMRAHWKNADKFLDAQGNVRGEVVELEGMEDYYAPGEWGPDCYEWGDIWYQARYRKPLDMSERDLELFVEMLLRMMRWDPEARPSTAELLKDEWFGSLRDERT